MTEREQIANDLDPTCPPDGDYLLNAIHADIQNNHPEVTVTHRNIVLHAVASALRKSAASPAPAVTEEEIARLLCRQTLIFNRGVHQDISTDPRG